MIADVLRGADSLNESPYREDRLLSLRFHDTERPVRIWQPSQAARAVILAIHGGLSHSGDYMTVGEHFRERDVVTVSFDLTGHGNQKKIDIPGFEAFLDDVMQMLDWTCSAYPGLPVFLMGHSMGGLIAAHIEMFRNTDAFPVKGVILSSPYFANAIPVPALLVRLSGIIAKLAPTAKVPTDDFTDFLTHDAAITARHYDDEKSHRRASEASFRFGRALLDAQAALNQDLSQWQHPVFAVLAGDDRLADVRVSQSMLNTIRPDLLSLHYFAENFHENFNELNRESIFQALHEWMQRLLKS